MNKKIKNLLTLSLLAVSTLTVASCGGAKAVPNFSIPEEGLTDQDITITFATTQGETSLKPITEQYIEVFEAMYPNIHVEITGGTGYDALRDDISKELAIGAGPDVAYCYPDHVALYNKSKRVVTLDNLINDTRTDEDGNLVFGLTKEQQEDFIEGYWNEGKQFGDGLMYTLPFSKSTEVLYYNEDFFAANNIKVPTHWFSNGDDDDTSMEYVCAAIKKVDPNSIPLGYDSAANWFITMCEQLHSPYTAAKGDHYLFDNDTNRDFVTKFKGWYNNGWVTTQGLYGSYTSGLFTSTDVVKSYMSIGSSAGANHQVPAKQDINVPNLDDNGNPVLDEQGNPTYKTINDYPFSVGIASIPQMDLNNPKVISQGPSVCIFNHDDPQKVLASWLLVRYLTTDVSYQAQFSIASGYVPVIKSVNDNETYKAFVAKANGTSNATALSAKVCLEQADAYYTSPAFYGSSTAREQVGALLEGAISGSKTVDQAFKDAINECAFKS